MEKRWFLKISVGLLLCFLAFNAPINPRISVSRTAQAACESLGWFPNQFELKDHSVFFFEGMYYIVSISQANETEFVYARSADLCEWEELGTVLAGREEGTWDELVVWAPFVMEEGGVFYMYYTGVTFDFTQSIMLATSTNPADPLSWQPHGMVFQPNHQGMVWEAGSWSDNRDPSVIKVNDIYYLYYTATDEHNAIVGLATATQPAGPWYDWGGILYLPAGYYPESALVYKQEGFYYIFYHNVRDGEEYRFGASPGGPWSEPFPFNPGWAHEVWQGLDEQTYTSYLTKPTVTISPLSWDSFYIPSRPFIGEQLYHSLLPLILGDNIFRRPEETRSSGW